MKASQSTSMEELMQAVLKASPARREDALRVLSGEATILEPGFKRSAEEPYRTLRNLAKVLNISTTTLWRWQVPARNLGGRRRYLLSEVQAYLKSEDFERRASDLRLNRRDAGVHTSRKVS